jgi:hypothetical protein
VGNQLVCGRGELANQVKGNGEGTTAVGESDSKLGLCNLCGEGENKMGVLEESGAE